MTKEKKETKCDELIDALLEKHGMSSEAVLGENGLIAQFKKRVVERALAGELTHHLGYAKGEDTSRRIVVEGITAQSRWFRAPATPRFRFYLPLNQLDD